MKSSLYVITLVALCLCQFCVCLSLLYCLVVVETLKGIIWQNVLGSFDKYVDVINSFKQKTYYAYHRSLDVNCFADICCRGPSDCATFDSLLEKIDQTRFVQIERWTCLPHRWFMKTMEVIIVSLSHGILISSAGYENICDF